MITVTLRTEESLLKSFDKLVKRTDRSRNYLINEAIENYMKMLEWQMAEVEEGIADAKAGRLIDHDVLFKKMKSEFSRKKKKNK